MSYIFFGLVFLPLHFHAQSYNASAPANNNRWVYLDSVATHTPKSVDRNVQTLTNHLVAFTKSDYEKAYVIFSWVAHHIQYDDHAFNSGKYPDMSASNVLKRRQGVCEGYSNLYEALCKSAGLECFKISGYAKGYGYRPATKFKSPNHSWNAVKFNGEWHLIDCTWAAGFGESINGRLMSKLHYDRIWFDVRPEWFIVSHFPEDAQWQVSTEMVSKEVFEQWLNIDLHLLIRFNNAAPLQELLTSSAPQGKVVLSYFENTDISVVTLPIAYILKSGEEYRFEFISDELDEILLYWNDKYTSFSHEGNRFWIETKARKGTLNISVKEKSGMMISLFQYEVK